MMHKQVISTVSKYRLCDGISEFSTYKDFVDDLGDFKHRDKIILEINSPGGSVDIGLMMVDAIQQSPKQVNAIITHQACSMAGMLALACDSLEMKPHSYLMLHDYSCFRIGKGNDLKLSTQAVDKMFKGRFKSICMPFLTEKECERILKGEDFYIHSDDRTLLSRIKRHFK